MDRINHYFRLKEDQDTLNALYTDAELAADRLVYEYIYIPGVTVVISHISNDSRISLESR